MSKPFDMELFLAGVLGDRTPPVNATFVTRKLSKQLSLNAGSSTPP